MATVNETKGPGGIRREVLFMVLFAVCSLSLFIKVTIPNRVADSSADLYRVIMNLPTDKPVFIQSDWTGSTRGESRAQFQAVVRMLMQRGVKFGFMSVGDPQAPEVARITIRELNEERKKVGLEPYRQWDDYVFVGFFPGAEASMQSISANLGSAIANNRDADASGVKRPVVESPVLQGVGKVEDLGAYIIVTGTKSSRIAIERLSGKLTMIGLVTGVMGPETFNYYQTGQLSGLSIGLKGAYDLETMMKSGLNVKDADGKVAVGNSKVTAEVPPFPSDGKYKTLDNAQLYIVPLHAAILLLIGAVIAGNVQMLKARKRGDQ